MILRKLQDKLRSVQGIERSQLAREFALSDDGVDAMLEIWVKKGLLKRIEQSACVGCTACPASGTQVIYQWK